MADFDKTDRGAYISLGLIYGALAGIGLGMLLAPKSGEETREHIRRRALEARDRAQSQLQTQRDIAREKLSNGLEKSKEITDKVSERAKDAADRAQEKANQTR
jgi:gas vesicle protein